MTTRSFTLTVDDITAAFRCHQALRLKGTQFYALIVTGLAGIALAFASDRPGTQYPLFVAATLLYLVLIVLVLRLFVRWFWLPRFVRRIMEQQKEFRQPQSARWDMAQFYLTSANGQSQLPFGEFHQFAVYDSGILLYRSEALFHILPATAFDGAADQAALITQLEQHKIERRSQGWQF